MLEGIHIKDYLNRPGMTQRKLADLLGIVQSAVSQMLADGRDIYVVDKPDGSVVAHEIRQVPVKSAY
jgi:predicted transcriptional regulator